MISAACIHHSIDKPRPLSLHLTGNRYFQQLILIDRLCRQCHISVFKCCVGITMPEIPLHWTFHVVEGTQDLLLFVVCCSADEKVREGENDKSIEEGRMVATYRCTQRTWFTVILLWHGAWKEFENEGRKYKRSERYRSGFMVLDRIKERKKESRHELYLQRVGK